MIKKLIVSIFLIFTGFSIFGQVMLNGTARLFLQEIRLMEESQQLSQSFISDYDLVPINGEYYIGILAFVDEDNIDRTRLLELSVINDTRIHDLWTFRVPVKKFPEFIQTDGIKYIEVGEPVSPHLEDAIVSSRVDSVHAGLGDLTMPYSGEGVIVAIIDWGFDYTHPVFYDTAYNHLRISRAWDQNKLSGPAPEGYSFGTEYVGEAELLAAGSDTTYVFGWSSHGSHVGGIAGGTGAGTPHRGVAFESELIFISLRRDAPSFVDAVNYITDYAASVDKPYVVNMSFGTHLWAHDGSCGKNVAMNYLHGPGRIFVGSAGNNGPSQQAFHLDFDFIDSPNDTLLSVINFQDYPDQFGQTLSMWGSENSSFEVGLIFTTNTNQILSETIMWDSENEPIVNDTIVVDNDSLIVRIQSSASYFLNNKPNIRLEVKKTGNTKLILKVSSEDSHVHIWNNVRMNNRYTNWGVLLDNNYPEAVRGNHDYALGEPAGTGANVITVGSHRAEMYVQGHVYSGQISTWSSMGPTVDERTKPDISSVGQNVMSSINSFNEDETGSLNIEFNDRTYGFTKYSGTSMSGPHVSGIVALMLQAHPEMSAVEAKQILKETARLDSNTGEIGEEGDLQWGWGKANALAAVRAAEIKATVPDLSITQQEFEIYPNPAVDYINISSNNSAFYPLKQIDIISMDGKTVIRKDLAEENYITVNISSLQNGVYVVLFQTDTSLSFGKLVVEK
jgi:minor extracellular serine protease Vpr